MFRGLVFQLIFSQNIFPVLKHLSGENIAVYLADTVCFFLHTGLVPKHIFYTFEAFLENFFLPCLFEKDCAIESLLLEVFLGHPKIEKTLFSETLG